MQGWLRLDIIKKKKKKMDDNSFVDCQDTFLNSATFFYNWGGKGVTTPKPSPRLRL